LGPPCTLLERQRPLRQASGGTSELDRKVSPGASWLGYILFVAAAAHPFGMAVISHSAIGEWLGVAICALGLFAAIWSRKTLGDDWSRDVEFKEGHKLVERGPYRFVRHPIYTSHLLMGLGTAVESGLLLAFSGLLLFFIGFWIKIKGGKSPAAALSRRIPRLQDSGKGACAIRILGLRTGCESGCRVEFRS
jgi:protein-S-isoprenylcysteine O-methyltransferase Ste14